MALLVVGHRAWSAGPLARYRELQATEANLRRYDDWRGSRAAIDDGARTGADEMKEQLRQRVWLWGGVIVRLGVVLIVRGSLVR